MMSNYNLASILIANKIKFLNIWQCHDNETKCFNKHKFYIICMPPSQLLLNVV